MEKNRTLFVGLDSACWAYYRPLLEEGRLPALQRLVESGAAGVIRSTMPAWTPTAWSSISTGKNPGKHGFYDMLALRPGSYESVPGNARMRLGTPFWTRLNEAGVRTGLVNIPFTHPPDEVDGFVVAGFGAPSGRPDFAYPAAARDWILETCGAYEPWLRFTELRGKKPGLKMRADLEHQARQVNIALHLALEYRVDVLAINLMAFDHANHWLPSMDLIHEVMLRTDQELQRLLDGFRPDNVLLFSDHGARRVRGDFLLHAWLCDRGYVLRRPRPPREARSVLNGILAKVLPEGLGLPRIATALLRRALLAAYPLLPASLRDVLWGRLERHIPFARQVYQGNEVDTSRSPWFLGSARSGLLYVNLEGRQPTGVVPPEAYERTVEELAARLRRLTDPKGRPVFSHVYRPREIYDGPAAAYAPDLVLDSLDTDWPALANLRRGPYLETMQEAYFSGVVGDFGQHALDGMYVFSGPGFARGESGEIAHMVDLPATLLHLYGVALPEDWDGKVMRQAMSGSLRERPAHRGPGDLQTPPDFDAMYSLEESDELVARLEALGYL